MKHKLFAVIFFFCPFVIAEAPITDTNQKIVNLVAIQQQLLDDKATMTEEAYLAKYVKEVYEPYQDFWKKYCCKNAETFAYVVKLKMSEFEPKIKPVLADIERMKLEALFYQSSKQLEAFTGISAKGTWYLVLSLGHTDLGAVGEQDMVIDFNSPDISVSSIRILMPHELSHLIRATNVTKNDANNVLKRIVNEGFGTYAGYRYFNKEYTPAENLFYTESEWRWALKHEKQIYEKIKPLLYSNQKEDENLVGQRNKKLFEDGPGAIGYFVGFRICQKYVEKHGEDSWVDLYTMSVNDIVEKSGYENYIATLGN